MEAHPDAPRRSGVNAPAVGTGVPKRGNFLTKYSMRALMRITGWKFSGGPFPEAKKFVLIVAPHTSNWDFPLGIMAMYSLGIRGTFLGKDTLFKFPLGILMRFLGGFPVDRSAPRDAVTQTADLAMHMERVIIVLSPEGTRKRIERWRTGFYWIARKAGLPILPVAFDYHAKEIRILPLFQPTDDQERDIAELRSHFKSQMAYDPAKYAE